jgi:hypothetical protein
MASIRTWHTYLGLLIAPSVLFFCVTGALQLFSLHEAHGSYEPALIIQKLGKVHKDQMFAPADRHEPPPAAGSPNEERSAQEDGGHEDKEEARGAAAARLLLKWFFLLVALGLATSTSFGIWMGLTNIRHKRVAGWLLLVGTVIPVFLVIA